MQPPLIAIPVPLSNNQEYVERAIPQYEAAVREAGGVPIRVPLDQSPADVMQLIAPCDALLLPGSAADVDPREYGAVKHPRTAAPDPFRHAVDQLLLQDAYAQRKPILGICYGLQSLNVYRAGTLVQHIESEVNHAAGRKLAVAHRVEIDPASKLAAIIAPAARQPVGLQPLSIPVNSSHHQSAGLPGEGLRVVAQCPDDGIVEAIESASPDHFVLAVQWHPERSFDHDDSSPAIFRALVEQARAHQETRHASAMP
jgi:putative glutamine amidotransferase